MHKGTANTSARPQRDMPGGHHAANLSADLSADLSWDLAGDLAADPAEGPPALCPHAASVAHAPRRATRIAARIATPRASAVPQTRFVHRSTASFGTSRLNRAQGTRDLAPDLARPGPHREPAPDLARPGPRRELRPGLRPGLQRRARRLCPHAVAPVPHALRATAVSHHALCIALLEAIGICPLAAAMSRPQR
ncbi:MAG: hypothetical protein QOH50_1812 [Kribbellaceae bacterium]|nr:hypothetical protein [Kribbellaceae bacterium]